MSRIPFFAAVLLTCLGTSAFPSPIEVTNVEARKDQNGWRFSVTLRHDDTGWDHYADGWRIVAPDGSVLGTRVLAHPHVNEQPFTRSLSGVAIPEGMREVFVETSDLPGGWTGKGVMFTLPE